MCFLSSVIDMKDCTYEECEMFYQVYAPEDP